MSDFPEFGSRDDDDDARVIVFEDLELSLRIGVYDTEKLKPQRVMITAEILVAPRWSRHDDRLDKVVDYATIHDGIMALADRPHVELQERLADEVARICLEPLEAKAARVYVRKMDAYEDCRSVGIRIVRRKPRP